MSVDLSDLARHKGSLSERTVVIAQEVLRGERNGWRSYLAFAGPAVIASIAYVDPGNFATNIQAGAKYGYGLLWVVLLANVIAMLFQALSAKLGIVTGRNLAEICRDEFSKPVVFASRSRSLTVPVALTEPLLIMVRWSHSNCASYMLFVLSRTVFPSEAAFFA